MASQGERRAQTRRALLDAAAALFAARGIEGASVDAVAAAAGRTSGAVYDHFGGKEGLVFALVEGWVDDIAAVTGAELAAAPTPDARLAALWRNVTDPVAGDGRWLALEHALWSWATRDDAARAHLAERYREAGAGIEDAVGVPGAGAAVMGLLVGLEMMRRVDPAAITDEQAVAALRAVVMSQQADTGRQEERP